MMIRSRMPSCSPGGIASFPRVVTAGPGVGWSPLSDGGVTGGVTGGTTPMVGATFPAPSHPSRPPPATGAGGSGGGADDDLGEVGLGAVLDRDQTGDPHQDVAGGGRLLEGQLRGVLQLTRGGDGEALQRPVGRGAGPDL